MPAKDLYEDLIRFYEFQLGHLPNRDEFKQALQSTFSQEDLRVFFLLPFFGMISKEKFEKKAIKAGMPLDELHRRVNHLKPEGLVDSFEGSNGRVYGRSPIIALLEFQVRLQEDSPMRSVCVKVMNDLIEGATETIPTRTPYYRVLPVEASLTGKGEHVPLNLPIPDPREVLPIDIVSEMIKNEPLIVVADCYCRSTKKLIGEDCGHPLETCFYFNDLALLKLETGYARQIDYEEAMRILRQCEQEGLVHNVSNCKGKIQTLCNCCTCSCGVMKSIMRGARNAGGPSRFVVQFEEERCTYCNECLDVCNLDNIRIEDKKLIINIENCIGCGQCVSNCPEGALRMIVRESPPYIFKDNDALFRRINLEAMAGLAWRKLRGS